MPLDARTDVFSAGIILHEMLTTEKLFRGDTEFALMEKVRKAEVPPPSNFNRRVPELDAIVLKALARDVPDRYQTAEELAADLDAFMAQYKFQAGRDAGVRARPVPRRLRQRGGRDRSVPARDASTPSPKRSRSSRARFSSTRRSRSQTPSPMPTPSLTPSLPVPQTITLDRIDDRTAEGCRRVRSRVGFVVAPARQVHKVRLQNFSIKLFLTGALQAGLRLLQSSPACDVIHG